MATLTLEIPNDKINYVLEGFLKIHPNSEKKPNPDYIDYSTTPETPQFLEEKVYTDKEWIRQIIMKKIIKNVKRGHELIAYSEINIQEDNTIIN